MHISVTRFQILRRRIIAARAVQGVDSGHVFVGQGKIEDIEITEQMIRFFVPGMVMKPRWTAQRSKIWTVLL